MSLFSTQDSPTRHTSSFGHTVLDRITRLQARATGAWQRHRDERALESLSYDTLKDIGFPSTDTTAADRAAR